MEDVAAVIGYTATTRLVNWFGGRQIYVPARATPEHPIAQAIGEVAFARLVQEFGCEILRIPFDELDRRDRIIADLVMLGKGSREIAEKTGLTERRVQQIRKRLEDSGILPLLIKISVENAQEKAGGEKSEIRN